MLHLSKLAVIVCCLCHGVVEYMRSWNSGASSTTRSIWRIGLQQWGHRQRHISSFLVTHLRVFSLSCQLNLARSEWQEIV